MSYVEIILPTPLTEEEINSFVSIPLGGTAGQALVKDTGADFDVSWQTIAGVGAPDWDDITGKPTFGTASTLDVAVSGNASSGQVVKGNDSRLTDARTPTTHTHTIADVTNLQTTLDGKFNIPTGDTTQYVAGDGSLVAFPIAGQSGTLVRQVRNETGTTLTKGTVVYIGGASGNKPLALRALATTDATSAQTFGVIQADIPTNNNGYVVVKGDLIGVDTSSYAEGSQLYLSGTVAGSFQTTKPVAPIHMVYVGVVTRQHATQGQIEVSIQNGYEVDELHDVLIVSKQNNDILTYESASGLWKNKTVITALGYTPYNATNPSGYTANSSDATLLNRTNHTGTQLASTISDFNTAADARVVAGITGKENTITAGTTAQYWRGDKTWQTHDKASVGLSNVDNTSDASKPVSTATQTALNLKQDSLVSGTNIKTVNGTTLLGSGNLSVGTVTNFVFTNANGFTGSVSTSTTTPTLSITLQNATGAQSGQLTSTDWNTFNGKESALTFSTGLTRSTNTITVNTSQNINTLSNLTSNGLIKTSGGTGALSIATAGTDYLTPFGSQTANFAYIAPNGSSGVPTFRALVAADIPTLNQNTTGSAATLTTARNIQGVAFNGSANIDILNGTGFVKVTGTTVSYDNSTYLTGNQTVTLSGDVTGSGSTAITTTIANSVVTNAKLANIATNTFKGRITASTGVVEDLTATQAKTILAITSGDVSGLGSLATASSVSLTTQATGTLQAAQAPAHTGDVTSSAGSLALTIANSSVTNAKQANVATGTIKGRVSASTGVVEDLTGTQATSLLDVFTTSTKGLVGASGGGTTNFLRADGTWAAPAGGGGGGSNAVNVTCDFGSSFTDIATTVVTGQSWVTSTSKIVAEVLHPDIDEAMLLNMKPYITNIVNGVGFTVNLYCENEAKGTYTVMCLGV